MNDQESAPTRISHATLAWLERESARWRADGLVDAEARDRILARYDADSLERRGMEAIVVVAILTCAVGLLLLIGYNWHRIPPNGKVAMIMAAVAAAFSGSAIAYRGGRQGLGETLAFSGTLLFGNAIWLIAQVLHISGRFPDAFLWFGLGAIATGLLVRSQSVGTGAAVAMTAWLTAEAIDQGGVVYLFFLVWPLTLGAAYLLLSPVMLRIAAFGVVPWLFSALGLHAAGSAGPAAVLLTGCALHAIGQWHEDGSRMRGPWQSTGLFVQLLAITPLMIQALQTEFVDRPDPFDATTVVVLLACGVVAVSAALRIGTPADAMTVVVAVATLAWLAGIWKGGMSPTVGTVLFSALTVGSGIASIRTALCTTRSRDLAFGVLFMGAFLVVRWVSVVDNMLLSGLLLVATGGGLLVLARMWSRRTPRPLEPRSAT